MKILKKILVAALIILVVIQLWRPEKNNAEYREVAAFIADTKPSTEITTILESKCYDCHSNRTVYPWYAEVAPISLWIADHIEEGNEHFNVSKWSSYDLDKKGHKLDELIEEVEEGHMPEDAYTWLHGKLTENEKEQLIGWAKQARIEIAK
ncbi:heme-binding domain-containing protein [uncultured Croceitalea sp.]|uniref:heme-binding domain-containing protein n=1 Tax=uncultured Croceitalea sp. TaxID=1798908 RepID=UPI00374ECCC3